ncbi:ankyrin-related protein [Cryptosporidium xiaoi]|uniref:Ankyrin-related protein n=1 Tax=Cryptosporidium xiaoi TaxID=659607 RepID=A0AAV9XXU0_9CRYT
MISRKTSKNKVLCLLYKKNELCINNCNSKMVNIVFIVLIYVLMYSGIECSNDFPVGCPLNTIKNGLVQVKNISECNCEKDLDDNNSDMGCLQKLDELHDKIRQQDYELVDKMLKKMCIELINRISPSSGETALLISTKQSGYASYMISMKLIEYGADVNKSSSDGKSPLINAIQGSNLPLVALLLLNGANIEGSDNNDVSPLFHSVIAKDIKMTHFLLKCGSSPNSMDIKGLTPLYYLLKAPMTSLTEEFFELLLDYGSSVTDITLDGKDSVSFLINSGNKHLLGKLIEHPNFARYIVRNNMQEEYLSNSVRYSQNSTFNYINKGFSNPKDKILRIINAIKMDFGHKILLSLIIPEVGNKNKDICLVKDEEGRTLIWWLTHYGDDELIKLLVNFYKVQSKSGVLEFEFCDLNEPDIYGNLPLGHILYNFDTKYVVDSNTKGSLPPKNITNSELDRVNMNRLDIIQDMLLFQNPRTNATLWYELVMNTNGEHTGERKIVEYLSSTIIKFPVLSLLSRCFCVPLEKSSISTPRSIPEIGTYEYDSVISILSLLLLLNKNYTSKIVLQSILRESMLQSFWCIQALQHALITATILGRDDVIRSILLGRVQTLSEVLSKLDYSSSMSLKIASRLLGSIPPEFPNLDDLMLIPITLLVRHIILTTDRKGLIQPFWNNEYEENAYIEKDNEDNWDENWNSGEEQVVMKSDSKKCENINNDSSRVLNTEFNITDIKNKDLDDYKNETLNDKTGYLTKDNELNAFESQFGFKNLCDERGISNDCKKNCISLNKRELSDCYCKNKHFKEEMRRGYFQESDTFSHLEVSNEYDSLLSNFEYLFSDSPKFFNSKEKNINGFSGSNDHNGNIHNSKNNNGNGSKDKYIYEKKQEVLRNGPEKSLTGSFSLLKQFLSTEMTKFVRPTSFEQIISLLQNSTCNYPRGSDIDEKQKDNFSDSFDLSGFNYLGKSGNGFISNKKAIDENLISSNNIGLERNNDHMGDQIKGIIEEIEGVRMYESEKDDGTNKRHIFDIFYKSEVTKGTDFRPSNCLIELPSICDLLINNNIIWVPMVPKEQVFDKIAPTGTLTLNSQRNLGVDGNNHKFRNEFGWNIPTLTDEYQTIHLGFLPKIPAEIDIGSLGQIISFNQLYSVIRRNGNCGYSTSYTTFDELLTKKARIITLLNSSNHHVIIPTITKTSFYIILTILLYACLWSLISYLKSLYINDMINTWSKRRLKKRNRIRKLQLKSQNSNKQIEKNGDNLGLKTLNDKVYKINNAKRDRKIYKRKTKKDSLSALYSFTTHLSKYIRNVLLSLLPSSLFKLKDYANVFPSPEKKTVSDSLLLSLSLIFTSPWYIYEKKNSISNNNLSFKNKIRKSILLNAPIDYFVGTNSSISKDIIKTIFKYSFFFIQVTSLIYLFIILLVIYEYEYIWFLIGIIMVSSFCTSVRIYYSFEFASSYCNKYFCGYSKDYYLYNYYYFKKNMKRNKNIRNIYSKLLGYNSYCDHTVFNNEKIVGYRNFKHEDDVFYKSETNQICLRNDDKNVDYAISCNYEEIPQYNCNFNVGIDYRKLIKSNTFPMDDSTLEQRRAINDYDNQFYTINGDNSINYENDSHACIGKTESENNCSRTNSSNNVTSNFQNESSSNITLINSIASSPMCTSPSFSSITIDNTQFDASQISSVNHNANSSKNRNNDMNLSEKVNVVGVMESLMVGRDFESEKRGESSDLIKTIIEKAPESNKDVKNPKNSLNNSRCKSFDLGNKTTKHALNGIYMKYKGALSPIASSSQPSSSSHQPRSSSLSSSLKKRKKCRKLRKYSLNREKSSPDLNLDLELNSNNNSNSPLSEQTSSLSANSISSPEDYRKPEAVNYNKYLIKSKYRSNSHSSILIQSASSYNDYLGNIFSRKKEGTKQLKSENTVYSIRKKIRDHINSVLERIRRDDKNGIILNRTRKNGNKTNVLGNRTDIRMNYRVSKNNFSERFKNNNLNTNINNNSRSSGGAIKLKKFKKLLSSEEERLSCDNIKTNLGNLVTNNKIYKPLYKLVDETSYNSPFEYFYIVSTCKVLSILIALSSNICIVLFKTNSYLFRDSTLYFLYNKSPFTLYLVECIFIYWLSNFIFELMKGLIILLFFVRQRKRLCVILAQHIPIQFKYSNVQEFIQIVSYWRSAMQHILYKNTKLWTAFINVFLSINSLLLFSIGKIMFVIICNKKNKIFNSKLFVFSSNKNEINDLDSEMVHDIFDIGTDDTFFTKTGNEKLVGNGVSDLNISPSSFSYYYYYGKHNDETEFNVGKTNNYDGARLTNDNDDIISLGEEEMLNSFDTMELDSGFGSYKSSDKYTLNYNQNGIGNTKYDYFSSSTENIVLSSIRSPTVSLLTSFIASKHYIEADRNNGIVGLITSDKFRAEFPNKYSNCEIIFLAFSTFMLIFLTFAIRLLYQVNMSSTRTHSWLESIIHRTPPGAGIYIVIEKVLLVINSTPPTIKIFGFNVNERFSGFNLYVFTPVFILIFIKFILF